MNQLTYRHSLSRSAELLDLYDMQMDAVVPIECTRPTFTTETHPCHEDQTMTITDWRQLETTMTMPPIWLDQKHHELVLAHEQLCPELATFLRSLGDPERRKVFVYHTRVSNFISIDQFRGGLQEYLAAAYLNNMASPSVSHVIVGIGFSIFEVAVYEHDESDESDEVVHARLLNESKKSRGEALDERVRLSFFDSVTNTTWAGVSLGDLGRLQQEFNEIPLPNADQLVLLPEHSQMFELIPIELFMAKARSRVDLFEDPLLRMDLQTGLDPALYALCTWRMIRRQLFALTHVFRDSTPREQVVESTDEKKALEDLWSCLPLCSQLGVGLLVDKSQLDAPEPRVKHILVFKRAIEQRQTSEWTFFIDAFTCMVDSGRNGGFFICTIEYFESHVVDMATEFTTPNDDVYILEHTNCKYRVLSRGKVRKWFNQISVNTYKTEWDESWISETPSQRNTERDKQSNAQDGAEVVRSFGEDMFELQTDAEPKSVELRRTLNLIMFGEANLINLLTNLAAFKSFDAAFKGEIKCLRPSTTAELLDQNEVQVDGEAFSCEVRVNDKLHLISIIDALSLDSTEKVVERIKQLDGLNAICFLLKPNQSGLPSEALDRLKEVLKNLRNDTSLQICFCYVNSTEEMNVQNEGSTTSDAMSLIFEIAKESGMKISCEASNSFCFDEKLFDFLSAKESNHLEESLVDAFRQSWEQSAASLAKLIVHAANQ